MELFRLLGTIAIDNAKANNELDFTTDKAEKSETRMSKAFKKIGTAVAGAFAVNKIADFGKACVDAAVSISAETAAFGQIMGDYSNQAQDKINEIAETTGIVNGRLTGYMTSMTAKFQGLGYDIDEATTMAQSGLTIAADAAAFWDKSMEDSMSALNSFVNGSYEGGEAIGLFANETTLAAWSAENLGFEWKNLTEKEKQFARLEFAKAMQETSGVTGQAANESEAYANVMGNLQRIWQEFMVTIGEPVLQTFVLPAMIKLQETLPVIGEHVQNLIDWFGEHKEGIENVATALGVALSAMLAFKAGSKIQSIIQSFQHAQVAIALYTASTNGASVAQGVLNGTLKISEALVALLTGKMTLAEAAQLLMTKAQLGLNTVMAANPIALVIAAITALVAAFVILWNKSESFREFWIGLWETIKEKIGAAKEFIKETIDKIKGFFNFKVELPKIKLPHFSIQPSGWSLGDLLKGSIPSLGIDWYAKGGVFDQPTIFPTASGLKGVGEAGAEAVAPISVLQGYVSDAVRAENTGLASRLDQLITLLQLHLPELAQRVVVLDSGEMVGALTPALDYQLGVIMAGKERGR